MARGQTFVKDRAPTDPVLTPACAARVTVNAEPVPVGSA